MAGIEEAFEKFADRLAREESKRYIRNQEGDYVEEVQDPYPVKLGPLQLGANANITTGKYSPDEYQNISTMNRNLGVRGKLNIPDTGISLLGSMGDVRSSRQNKLNLPFNPMTGEAEPYSETMRDVYKESPYSVGAQYNPPGTDQLFSALYNKGGGYNLGYNQGPVNVSYTSNPGLGNNIMVRGQYNFADGGIASMFRERPGYQIGGTIDPFALQRSPIDLYGYSDPVIAALTGNVFTSGQRFKDVFSGQAGLMMQQAQAAGYSEPEMEELRRQHDMFPGFQNNLMETILGQADPQQYAINFATDYRNRFLNPQPYQSPAQQRPQTQYQYSSKGTPILQYGYTGTPSAELQSQIDLQKRALDRLESIYNKPMANIGGDERVHAFGNTGGYKYNQNELLQNILRSEQEAAARVTPKKMAFGGLASFNQGGQVKSYEEQTLNKKGYETTGMSKKEIFDLYDSVMGTFSKRFAGGGLTNTIPPVMGPDSQGVESLFRRRYN